MTRDLFEEPRREEREPTANDERKHLRRLWKRMQDNYAHNARSWDWALSRIEARRKR